MELKFTPSFFYGSAAAALMGLSLGVALHGPWEQKAGGPRLLFSSAAAADLAQPADDGDIIQASGDSTQMADTYLYDGYLPADPLPVVRLKPDRYPDIWSAWQGVTQASVDQGERVNPDDIYKADVFADDELQTPEAGTTVADDELPATGETPRAPVRYSALQAAESNPSF
jgi:hypothetical protein